MPPPIHLPLTERAAAALRAVEVAQQDARAGALALDDAHVQERALRALLASRIREAAQVLYGTVQSFCAAVEARRGVPAKTVQNNLYGVFSPDVLTTCADVLAQRGGDSRTARSRRPSRQAA